MTGPSPRICKKNSSRHRPPACRPAQYFRPAGAAAALRRKSAPGGGAVRRFQRIFPATARQGTFVQQHSGLDGGGEFDCGIFNDLPTLAILKHTNPCGVGQGAHCARRGTRRLRRTNRRRSAASSRLTATRRRLRRKPSRKFSARSSSRRISRRKRWRFCKRKKICGC